jgi:hypothetical protein
MRIKSPLLLLVLLVVVQTGIEGAAVYPLNGRFCKFKRTTKCFDGGSDMAHTSFASNDLLTCSCGYVPSPPFPFPYLSQTSIFWGGLVAPCLP